MVTNEKKAKTMIMANADRPNNIGLNGRTSKSFKHLGIILKGNGRTGEAFDERMGMARRTFNEMKRAFIVKKQS